MYAERALLPRCGRGRSLAIRVRASRSLLLMSPPQPSPRKSGAREPRAERMTAQPLLDVNDLTVEFATRRGIVKAVQHVNISVAKGETLGIVGEFGSGKSVTSYAVMRILDRAGKIAEGSVMFSGIDVKAATENQMRDLRGREISMIFQNPRAALNPIRKVGDQIEDVLRQHVQSGGERSRREGDRGAGAGQDRAPARALSRLSVRTFRRHVPARRDRAGAGLQSAASDRGRADHRPRRHHAEGRDGPDRRTDKAARHVDHPDHA